MASPHNPAADAAKLIEQISTSIGDRTIGAQQLLLLLALYTYGAQSQSALNAFTGVGESANSRNIKRLGKGEYLVRGGKKVHIPGPGWVESDSEDEDQRSKMVKLTAKGHALIRTAVDAIKNPVTA